MSANMMTRYTDVLIDDYINWTENAQARMLSNDASILNMCLTNGVMGREDQRKLRQLYPNLYKEVEKFLSKKHGTVFIYEEEGKPKVVNVFIHNKANETTTNWSVRRSASRSIKAYMRSNKISQNFVYIDEQSNKHRQMIEDTLKYQLNWSTYIDKLRLERIGETTEDE